MVVRIIARTERENITHIWHTPVIYKKTLEQAVESANKYIFKLIQEAYYTEIEVKIHDKREQIMNWKYIPTYR